MKKMIILNFFIYYIYCSAESCYNEKDRNKCQNHIIEYENYACYKYKDESVSGEYEIEYCRAYPNNPVLQKDYRNIDVGVTKELISFTKDFYKKNYYQSYNKENYEKDETIYLIYKNFTDAEMKIYNSNNTCSYQLVGRYYENKQNYPDGYPDINDKNICFNTEQFNELKDLINCGYAEFKINHNNKSKIINSCFLLEDDNFPKQFKNILKDKLDTMLLAYSFFLQDNLNNLTEKLNFEEIIIEDKNGKKMKYTYDSEELELIEEKKKNNSKLLIVISLIFSLIILIILFMKKF